MLTETRQVERQAGRFVAVIPARGGSKRVPRKNVALLGGRPLIAWTIEAALGASYVGKVVVSTDDDEIQHIAQQYLGDCRHGCVVRRPPELATDQAPSAPVVLHAWEQAGSEFDMIVLLQPTSPLRSADDIEAAARVFAREFRHGEPIALTSITPALEPAKAAVLRWVDPARPGAVQPFSPQPPAKDAELHRLNGAMYMLSLPSLRQWAATCTPFLPGERLGYVMPAERSLDIDTPEDMRRAEGALAERLTVGRRATGLQAWKEGRV